MKRMLEVFTDADLLGLTPLKARDLVVGCFFNAQVETFRRVGASRGAAPSEAELRRMVEGAVRASFRATGGVYERPTRATLLAAVGDLADKAASMGTPPDIIEHHKTQLGRVFAALEADAETLVA